MQAARNARFAFRPDKEMTIRLTNTEVTKWVALVKKAGVTAE